jgi:hypothetical protein
MNQPQDEYRADATNASPPFDDAAIKRLVMTAHELIEQGYSPSEIEGRIFGALVPGADLAAAIRGRLFRVMTGLPARPLSIREASDLVGAIARALRGAPDLEFTRQFALAHTRGRLLQAAHDCAEHLRRDGVVPSRDNLALAMMMAVTRVRHECELILRNLTNLSIETRIDIAVRDYFGGPEK